MLLSCGVAIAKGGASRLAPPCFTTGGGGGRVDPARSQRLPLTRRTAPPPPPLPPTSTRCANSIGNFFFTGARLFFGSLAAAILLWKMISNIPTCTEVLPVVDSQTPLILAAQLGDAQNTKIVGQNVISHPEPAPTEVNETETSLRSPSHILSPSPQTPPEPSSAVDKRGSGKQALPDGSRIKRVFYVDEEGTEYSPTPSEGVLRALRTVRVVQAPTLSASF